MCLILRRDDAYHFFPYFLQRNPYESHSVNGVLISAVLTSSLRFTNAYSGTRTICWSSVPGTDTLVKTFGFKVRSNETETKTEIFICKNEKPKPNRIRVKLKDFQSLCRVTVIIVFALSDSKRIRTGFFHRNIANTTLYNDFY